MYEYIQHVSSKQHQSATHVMPYHNMVHYNIIMQFHYIVMILVYYHCLKRDVAWESCFFIYKTGCALFMDIVVYWIFAIEYICKFHFLQINIENQATYYRFSNMILNLSNLAI